VSRRKYFVLALVVVFGSAGNVLLSRGMKDVGQIEISHWIHAISALANPWVATGTVLLIGFMATYMTALSWADLTYVLPATSVSYILIALLGRFILGEHITALRWLGIALVTGGVGFVAGGRSHTPQIERIEEAEKRSRD
jgi:drug/metabolite transporter (DMT)-like permease